MYKFEFGQREKLTAYLFEVDSDGAYKKQPNSTAPNFKQITGAYANSTFIYDPVGGSDYFPAPIMKTSFQLNLIRTDEADFIDIVTGEDNTWWCVVCLNETSVRATSVLSGKRYPVVNGEEVAFKGIFTNQTYSEEYKSKAEVNLTFHDRIGELKEVNYYPLQRFERLTKILHDLLQGTINERFIRIEYPYEYEGDAIKPDNVILDVSVFWDKKREEVLSKILADQGLQLFSDFSIVNEILSSTDYNYLSRRGVARIRHLGKYDEINSLSYCYRSNGTTYVDTKTTGDPIPDEETVKRIREMGVDLKIEGGASYELIKRAKFLDVTAKFVIAKSLLFPDELSEDFLEPVNTDGNYFFFDKTKYSKVSPDYTHSKNYSNILLGVDVGNPVPVNNIGSAPKLGLMLIDKQTNVGLRSVTSKRALVIMGDGDNALTFTGEVWSEALRNIHFSLLAYSYADNEYKQYKRSDNTWVGWNINGSIIENEFIDGAAEGAYSRGTWSDIPHPDFALAESYFVIALIFPPPFTGTRACFVTEMRLFVNNELGLPPSLTIRTNISEGRRSGINEEVTFINLPNIDGDKSYYRNGYYLDMAGEIISPDTITFENNTATLLVHFSELIGGQMTAERWKFMCRLHDRGENTFSLTVADWSGYVCVLSGVDNTGIERAATLTVTYFVNGLVDEQNSYSILHAIPDTAFALITLQELQELSDSDYLDRLAAFRAYVSSEEGITITNFETNSPYRENLTGCPIPSTDPVNIIVEALWTGTDGASNGFGGSLKLLDSDDIELDEKALTQFGKFQFELFTQPASALGYKVDFSDVLAYIDAEAVPIFFRWNIEGGAYSGDSETSLITESSNITLEIQETEFI